MQATSILHQYSYTNKVLKITLFQHVKKCGETARTTTMSVAGFSTIILIPINLGVLPGWRAMAMW
jgi:hypothetical protein